MPRHHKPRVHGADHTAGLDPVKLYWDDVGTGADGDGDGTGTGIRFSIDNVGDLLNVQATDYVDLAVPPSSVGSAHSGVAVYVDGVTLQSHWSGSASSIPDIGTGVGVWIFTDSLHIWGLPTSAPSEPGHVWNDGGTLKIT